MREKKRKYFSSAWLLVSVFLLFFGGVILYKSINHQCANALSCEESLEQTVDNEDIAIFNGKNIEPPDIDLFNEFDTNVLGSESSSSEKRIDVDLTSQTLKAFDGENLYFETKISSGKWFPTPTGEFTIWKSIRSTKMSGGEGNDYYYLPNVPYVMFFSNSRVSPGLGFALHGAYWHNNFGHAMSHGCVNMRTVDAKTVYEWVNSSPDGVGAKITIHGEAT